jgi:hypothetical protein
MLNLASPRPRAPNTPAHARARAIENLRRLADRVAAHAATREPAPVPPAKRHEPEFWILHAR